MEPEGSLPHSKELVTVPYPVPEQSRPCPTSLPALEDPFCIIFLSTPGSSKQSLHQILYSPFLCPILVTCPAHLILLNHQNKIFLGIISLCSSLLLPCYTDLYARRYYSPVISSLLGPSIFLSTLFPNTLSLCDQVSLPHKQQAKLYFCVF
jgi:hypothetical protein